MTNVLHFPTSTFDYSPPSAPELMSWMAQGVRPFKHREQVWARLWDKKSGGPRLVTIPEELIEDLTLLKAARWIGLVLEPTQNLLNIFKPLEEAA